MLDEAKSVAAAVGLPHILVTDDSRMVRASIVKHLRAHFEIREEADGEAGWQALLVDEEIRLLICDLGMPKLDGFGLLERIRTSKIPRLRDIPVIIISGDEDDASRERARALGASDFITKGTGTVELVARCESLMALARANRQLEENRQQQASQTPVEPHYGLLTPAYFDLLGEQALSYAKRHYGEVNVLLLDIDGLELVRTNHGDEVVNLVVRKLAKILGTRVRREDGVMRLGDERFAVLAPGIGFSACSAFAIRLKEAIAALPLMYRGQALSISLCMGLANFPQNEATQFDELMAEAIRRLKDGIEHGGNCLMGADGIILQPPRTAEVFSVERALMLLRHGKRDELRPHLAEVLRRLLPLLDLAEQELGCPLALAALEQACKKFGSRAGEEVPPANGATPP